MTKIGMDMREVNELAVDLAAAGQLIRPAAEKAVRVGALKIKKGAASRIRSASEAGHIPGYPASITYDVESRPFGVSAEIGPDKDRNQGALGNLLEYGTSDTPPIPHLQPALEAEAPIFAQKLADAGGLVLVRRARR